MSGIRNKREFRSYHGWGLGLGLLLSLCLNMSLIVKGFSSGRRWQPLPDYYPTSAVLFSEDIFSEDPGIIRVARESLEAGTEIFVLTNRPLAEGEKADWLTRAGFDKEERKRIRLIGVNHDNRWLRDFSPFTVHEPGKDASSSRFVDFRYGEQASLSDIVPYQLAIYFEKSLESVDLVLDGGNLLTDGWHCYTGVPETMTTVQAENLKLVLRDRMGCRQVVLIHNPVHPHIDMWAQLPGPDHAVVHQITDEMLELAARIDPEYSDRVEDIRDALDHAAKHFALSKKVLRIPMPLPSRDTFRTFTNALLVNGRAIIPTYRTHPVSGRPWIDLELIQKYEQEIRSGYEGLGYRVTFVTADRWTVEGGAIHCLTAQIPRIQNHAGSGGEGIR